MPLGPGVTPGRATVVTLDADTIDNVQEPSYWHELDLAKISEGDKNNPPKVVLVPEIGWQLSSYNALASYLHEGTQADTGIQDLNTPSGFGSLSLFRRPDDLEGAGGSLLKVSGDEFKQKLVPSGTTWDGPSFLITADQGAYASPDTESDNIAMDRVGKSTDNHLPTEKIVFRFFVPGLGGQAKQTLISIYFSGVSGRLASDPASGIGQYCLKLYGDGLAKLFERLATGNWALRHTMSWTHRSKVVGSWHFVVIASDARFNGTTYTGTKVGFQFQSVSGLVESFIGVAVAALGGPDWQYYRPKREGASNPTVAPIRLDCRRDVRALFQVSKAVHFPIGNLSTVPFALPFTPTSTTPLRFEWYGDIPTGTSIDVSIFRADAVGALTPTGDAGSSTASGYKSFYPFVGVRNYFAVIQWTASGDGKKTPNIYRIRVVRDNVLHTSAPGETVVEKKDRISITGPSADPSHETASLVVHDRSGPTFPLFYRAGMPIRIEVRYDPNDEDKTSTLFQGRVVQAKTSRRPKRVFEGFEQKRLDPIQKHDLKSYQVQALGEWMRLGQLLTPKTYNFALDPTDPAVPQPYKVTDVIRILLGSHFPDSMIDVPDLSLRLFADEKQSWLLEVYTEVLPIVQSLARDYLGAYLIYDPNATNGGTIGNKYGCWRLKVPPRPPYNNLAEFVLKPNFEGPKIGVNLDAYPSVESGLQTIKRCWVRYGTMREWVIPPECNYVFVQGATPAASDALAVGSEKLQAEAYNFISAEFMPGQPISADPSHPDYVGYMVPYILSDPGLTSEAAVKFACRRIYDISAHAQKRIAFEAPVVLVTDANDTLQQRPRKLQFGDPVLFEGAQFIVDSCNVDYSAAKGGDRIQMANYELFSVPALQSYGSNLENVVQAGVGLFSMAL